MVVGVWVVPLLLSLFWGYLAEVDDYNGLPNSGAALISVVLLAVTHVGWYVTKTPIIATILVLYHGCLAFSHINLSYHYMFHSRVCINATILVLYHGCLTFLISINHLSYHYITRRYFLAQAFLSIPNNATFGRLECVPTNASTTRSGRIQMGCCFSATFRRHCFHSCSCRYCCSATKARLYG